jgi:ribonucleoside-diphosphate reductase alpha chain
VTLSKAPIKEINETVANNRKIGLGIMGFADCLIQLGITYGSKESFEFAEQLAKRIKEVANKTSVDLGKEKGLPLNSKFYENTTPGTPDLKGTPRNSCQISYAPTGTIASIADASFGIEPLYDVCFIKNILDGKRVFFVSDIVAEHLKELGYEKAVKEIESGKTLDEIDIPVKIKKLFATTYTLTPEQHVTMQASFQKYCDSAISKTCNLPNSATKEDVANTYFMAYDMGCKGITVYRDGSRQLQVIETGKNKKESKIVKRPDVVQGLTYKIQTSFGKLYMTINRDGDIPIEVFFSMADISNDMSSLLSALGRTLSVSLKHGTPLKDIIKTLRKIKVGTVVYYNGKMFKSVPQLIAGVLEEVFLGKDSPAILVSLCDKCGSQLIIQEGCEKCSNPECGYTKCG